MFLRKTQTVTNYIIKLMKKWYEIELIYWSFRYTDYHYKQKDMGLMQNKSLTNYRKKMAFIMNARLILMNYMHKGRFNFQERTK